MSWIYRIASAAGFAALTAVAASAQDGYQPPWPGPDEDVVAWQIEHIDAPAARLVWSEPDMLAALEREMPRVQPNLARTWFRWEALSADAADTYGGRSLLLLREADCRERKARFITMTIYAGNNLTGSSNNVTGGPSDWTYDRPGKLGDAQTAAACEGTMMFNDDDVRRWIKELGLN